MRLEMIRVDPEVAKPGQQIHVSGAVPSELAIEGEAVVQLLNASGQSVAESVLVPGKTHMEASLEVPPTAEEGPYELVILSQGRHRLLAALMVLSELSLDRLKGAFTAEQKRNKAYDLVGNNELELAAHLLSSAEAIYRENGWEHLEAETILERAHVLEKAGHELQHKELLEAAMAKFHLAGVKSKQAVAYGKAWLYFEKAIDLAAMLNRERDLNINRNNLGEVLLRLELLREAKENLVRALGGALKLQDRTIEAMVRTNLGSVYVRERQFNEALAQWHLAVGLFNKVQEYEKEQQLLSAFQNLRQMLATGQEGEFKATETSLETLED